LPFKIKISKTHPAGWRFASSLGGILFSIECTATKQKYYKIYEKEVLERKCDFGSG
jgi:hypothetical protein